MSSSDVSLVPYSQILDGNRWTLPNEVILTLGAKAHHQCVLDLVFSEGVPMDPRGFLAVMQAEANVPVVIFAGQDAVGAAWLNGVVAGRAFGHFLFLEEGRGAFAREAGRAVLKYWRALGSVNVILGMVPSWNVPAIEYVQEIGLTKLGEIPRLFHGQPATLLYYAE